MSAQSHARSYGHKRKCQQCKVLFYDFGAQKIVCPGCGAEFDQESAMKLRRQRPLPGAGAEKPAEDAAGLEGEAVIEDVDDLTDDEHVSDSEVPLKRSNED